MKKTLLIFSLLVLGLSVSAQQKNEAVVALEKAKESSVHAKRSTNPTTWLKLADAYFEVYEAPKMGATPGFSMVENRLILAKMRSSSTENKVVGGIQYEVVTYPTAKLYYLDGVLDIIEVVKPLVDEDPLDGAYKSLLKAYELDEKGSKKEDIITKLSILRDIYVDEAISANKLEDVKGANEYFQKALQAKDNAVISELDTAILFYVGVTHNLLGEHDEAVESFKKCYDAGYFQDGDVISSLAEAYMSKGNPEEAKRILGEGFVHFPSNQAILVNLINVYRETNDDPSKVLDFIRQGIANEPNNASLYLAEGDVYKRLGDIEKAIECFNKSLEIDPTYFFGAYSIGNTYYEQAIEIQTELNNLDISDNDGYNRLTAEFEETLIKSIQPFEDAFKLAEGDLDSQLAVAEALKQIYFRFRTKSAEYAEGFQKYDTFMRTNTQ